MLGFGLAKLERYYESVVYPMKKTFEESDFVKQLNENLKTYNEEYLMEKDYELKHFQECLAKSRIYLKLLSSIKNFTTYTFLGVPAKRLFDKNFATIIVSYARDTYWCCKHLSDKIVI